MFILLCFKSQKNDMARSSSTKAETATRSLSLKQGFVKVLWKEILRNKNGYGKRKRSEDETLKKKTEEINI